LLLDIDWYGGGAFSMCSQKQSRRVFRPRLTEKMNTRKNFTSHNVNNFNNNNVLCGVKNKFPSFDLK
jgi:hypothetical protein